ncbi:MAG: regulatory protein RecX [Candidatus Baltobacteraceae bacterium]
MRKGHAGEDVRSAVETCKSDGYLDDDLFARLFVEGKVKAVGDARLVAELVRRGVEREAAQAAVERAPCGENERLLAAAEKLFRTRPALSYPSAARSLERLGFPTPAIYRLLRERIRCAGAPSDR